MIQVKNLWYKTAEGAIRRYPTKSTTEIDWYYYGLLSLDLYPAALAKLNKGKSND